MVIRHDNDIKMPNKWVLLILDTKSGVMEVIRYKLKAISDRTFGFWSALYLI